MLITYWLEKNGHHVGMAGTVPATYDMVAVLLNEEPVGEWSDWFHFGSVEKRTRTAKQSWVVIRPFTAEFDRYSPFAEYRNRKFVVGEILEREIPNYYSDLRGGEGRDICMYCGFDTTDMRSGWDCGACGSN